MLECNQRVIELSYQVPELHWEAAIGVVLNVHNFSVVGQNEKLPTSEKKKKVKYKKPHRFVKSQLKLCR